MKALGVRTRRCRLAVALQRVRGRGMLPQRMTRRTRVGRIQEAREVVKEQLLPVAAKHLREVMPHREVMPRRVVMLPPALGNLARGFSGDGVAASAVAAGAKQTTNKGTMTSWIQKQDS